MIKSKTYEFIRLDLVDEKPKTGVWSCKNIKSGVQLGTIKWHFAWRQYCYFPTVQAIYSKGCLEDINSFITLVSTK